MMSLWQTELTIPTTSYANAGGTGNRTASITATSNETWVNGSTPPAVVDGDFTADNTHSLNTSKTVAAGAYVRFDFGALVKKYIDEVKLYYSTTPANGSWKIRGSNDASSWTDLVTFTWNTATQTVTLTGMDAAGYRYYDIISPGGVAMTAALWEETEFKIAPGAT